MDSPEKISPMDAILFALSLEVALMQMQILALSALHIFTHLHLMKTKPFTEVISSVLLPSRVIYRLFTNQTLTESSTELRAHLWKILSENQKLQREKLVRDRGTVRDVIRQTLLEIAETGQWYSLQNAIEVLKNQVDLALSKRQQYRELRRSKKSIAIDLNAKRYQWAVELRNADVKTALLRDKINDDQLNANARLAYAEKWMVAQAESLELEYDQPRPPPPRPDHEERVHQELVMAYTLQIQEREESVKYWEQRYGADIEDIKARVVVIREELKIAIAHHSELQKLYNEHDGEIRGWLTFKRERAARIAREEHLRASATRIQSWWRGLMVRRALGQFKFLKNIKKSAKGKKK